MTGQLVLTFIDPASGPDEALGWFCDQHLDGREDEARAVLARSEGQSPAGDTSHHVLTVTAAPDRRATPDEAPGAPPFEVREQLGPWVFAPLGPQRGSGVVGDHLVVALTSALPGRDRELNEWYDSTHLAEALALRGFETAQRFRLDEEQSVVGGSGAHQYLALYQASGEVQDLWQQITTFPFAPTDTVDFSTALTVIYTRVASRGSLADTIG